nr:hypothetical protein [Tanacetum cinerariifolium]
IVTTAVPTPRAKGIVFHEQKQSQIPSVSSSKDKGKAKMIEPEVPIKRKEQMRINEEYSRKLEAKEQEAVRLSRAQQDEEANNSWDNMQAMIEAERIQAIEREEISKVQKARLLLKLIEKRKKHFAALSAQENRNKPPTKVDKNVKPVIDENEELKKCMEIVPDDGDEANTQAMMEAERIQAIEREEFSKVQKARLLVKLIEKRKKHFAALSAQ